MRLPLAYAKMPRHTPIKADVPVAKPSNPSVIFDPFDTAVIIKITMPIYNIHVYSRKPSGNNLE